MSGRSPAIGMFRVQFMRIMSIYPSDPHSYYSFTEIYINLRMGVWGEYLKVLIT